MEKIFISHRGKSTPNDYKKALELTNILRQNGFETFNIDNDEPNTPTEWMNEHLEKSDKLLIVMTPHFRQSDYTMKEVWAFYNHHIKEHRRFRMIIVDKITNKDMPILLNGVIYLDLTRLPEDQHKQAVLDYMQGKPPPLGQTHYYSEDICNISLTSYFPRPNDEANIASAFVKSRRVVLHAHGGMGKSTLAKAYALSKQADYDAVWFVNAETPDQARASLVELARAMGIDGTPAMQLEALKAKLTSKVLLVLDNLLNKKALKGLETGKALLLITARDPHWGGVAEEVLLHKWEMREGAKYMQSIAGFADSNLTAAETLSAALDGLPLGLKIAASLMETTNETPQSFILHLTKRVGEIITSDETGEYPYSIKQMVKLAESEANKKAKGASRLLALLASFASTPIPKALLQDNRSFILKLLSIIKREAKFEEKLIALTKTGLIEGIQLPIDKPEWQSAYLMHRLTKLVVGEKKQSEAMVLVANAFPYNPTISENWAICRLLVPHAEEFLNQPVKTKDETAFSFLLNQWALFENNAHADYEKAKQLYERRLDIEENKQVKDEREIATTLSNLSTVLASLGGEGNLSLAEKHLHRALKIDEMRGDEAKVATRCSNLAHVFLRQGKLEEAENLANRFKN